VRHSDQQTLLLAGRQLREQVLGCLEHIGSTRESIPHLDILNPPLWELGHIGWFQEFWCLRGGDFAEPSLLANADDLYNSTDVIHARRWSLPLGSMAQTQGYVQQVFDAASQRLADCGGSEADLYFHRLSHFHEAMHLEAFLYSWQTLAYPKPTVAGTVPQLAPDSTDLDFQDSSVQIGSRPTDGFCFDNEKWAQQQLVPGFAIANQPVTNRAFAAFVSDGGYHDKRWWDDSYFAQLQRDERVMPVYWSRQGDDYFVRFFDQHAPMQPNVPVLNISAYEAQAYCEWAGRRLPSEAEWVVAASDSRCRWGGLGWEWTSSPFEPLPGFSPDPYKEYSEPWFHTHRVVRGGSFATPSCLTDIRYRNFYQPWRSDPFFTFRTCAL
jgi:iron(II)-dependent oxidoreductase